MTNREYLIAQLSSPDWIDDDGEAYKTTVYCILDCPYGCGNPKALCQWHEMESDISTCFKCKEKWLDDEVDE